MTGNIYRVEVLTSVQRGDNGRGKRRCGLQGGVPHHRGRCYIVLNEADQRAGAAQRIREPRARDGHAARKIALS